MGEDLFPFCFLDELRKEIFHLSFISFHLPFRVLASLHLNFVVMIEITNVVMI